MFCFIRVCVVEELEGVRIRSSAQVQHGLVVEPEVQQTFVCVGGCHSQGFVDQRGANFWPLRSWLFLRPRLRVLQLQHRQRLPRDWARALPHRVRGQPRLVGVPFLEPEQGLRPRLCGVAWFRLVFPHAGTFIFVFLYSNGFASWFRRMICFVWFCEGGRGGGWRRAGNYEKLDCVADVWRCVRPPMPEGRACCDSAVRFAGKCAGHDG